MQLLYPLPVIQIYFPNLCLLFCIPYSLFYWAEIPKFGRVHPLVLFLPGLFLYPWALPVRWAAPWLGWLRGSVQGPREHFVAGFITCSGLEGEASEGSCRQQPRCSVTFWTVQNLGPGYCQPTAHQEGTGSWNPNPSVSLQMILIISRTTLQDEGGRQCVGGALQVQLQGGGQGWECVGFAHTEQPHICPVIFWSFTVLLLTFWFFNYL